MNQPSFISIQILLLLEQKIWMQTILFCPYVFFAEGKLSAPFFFLPNTGWHMEMAISDGHFRRRVKNGDILTLKQAIWLG